MPEYSKQQIRCWLIYKKSLDLIAMQSYSTAKLKNVLAIPLKICFQKINKLD